MAESSPEILLSECSRCKERARKKLSWAMSSSSSQITSQINHCFYQPAKLAKANTSKFPVAYDHKDFLLTYPLWGGCMSFSLWDPAWWAGPYLVHDRHTSFYCASQILCFLQIEDLWQLCIEQVFTSVSYLDNSCNISNVFIIIICDLWSVTFDITILIVLGCTNLAHMRQRN